MGLQFGLEGDGKFCKRANRWLFEIPEVCADDSPNVNALPPEKGARPTLSFKEMIVQHLIEDVYYPAKPDWKPVSLTLFDLSLRTNPIFEWIQQVYQPQEGHFFESNRNSLIKTATLKMLNGCGTIIETWIFEDAWPQSINFQNLDMCSSAVMMCEITLRYARAYLDINRNSSSGESNNPQQSTGFNGSQGSPSFSTFPGSTSLSSFIP